MKRILLVALSLIVAMIVLIGLYGATQTNDVFFIVIGIIGIVAWVAIVIRSLMRFDSYEHKNIL